MRLLACMDEECVIAVRPDLRTAVTVRLPLPRALALLGDVLPVVAKRLDGPQIVILQQPDAGVGVAPDNGFLNLFVLAAVIARTIDALEQHVTIAVRAFGEDLAERDQ